jgi:sulfur carrier protein ThiS
VHGNAMFRSYVTCIRVGLSLETLDSGAYISRILRVLEAQPQLIVTRVNTQIIPDKQQ